jgi:molybdopterin-guanine dinucleotide biosynthesis protein A
VARQLLTGVLLVGGASRRFGSAKALARVGEETLAERSWRVLGEACDERLAVGKAREVELPFAVRDDGVPVRAPIAGVVAGLRAARHEVVVFLPVDCPLATAGVLRALGEACRDAAVPSMGPLPGAWARSALPTLERRLAGGELSLVDAYRELDVAFPALDESLLADADTPEELARLTAAAVASRPRTAKKTQRNEEQRRQQGESPGSSKQRAHEQAPSHPMQKTTHPVRD